MSNLNKKNKGFTMIEAFVAITVLLVAVLGPLTLITRAINDGNYAKYQVISSFLVQEGLDLAVAKSVEYANDNNISNLGNGGDCKPAPSNSCRIYLNPANGSIIIEKFSSAIPNFFNLYTDPTGIYSHTSGDQTIFTRRIWFKDITDGDSRMTAVMNFLGLTPEDEIIGRKVFVQVDWTYKGLQRTQIASTMVYE